MPKNFLIVLSLLFFVACNKVNNNNTPSTPTNNLISTAYTPQNVLAGSDSNKFVFNLSTTNNNANNNSKVNSASTSNYQVKISEVITYQGVKYPANTTFNITTNSNGQVVFYYNPPANLNGTRKQINFTFTNTTQNITQTISASVNIQTGFVINPYANNYNTTTSDTGAFILNIISDGITPRSYVYTIPTTDSIYDYQKQRLLNLNNPYDSLTSKSSASQIAFNLGLITKLVNSNRVLTISVNDANNGNINRTATIAFNVALGNWGFSISASTVNPNITTNDTGTINLRIKSDGSVARTYVLYPAIADSILYNNTLYNNGKAINLFTSATIDTTINLGFITKIASNRTVNLLVKDLSNTSQSASVSFNIQSSSAIGIAVGINMIYRTTDDGITWSSIKQNITGTIIQVAFSTSKNGILVGGFNSPGFIYRTTDAGLSWNNVFSNTVGIYGATFTTPSNGFAVGVNGTIFKTTDSGATWTSISSGITNDLSNIRFSSPSNGIIVGNGGAVIRTTDGGNTWSSVVINIPSSSFFNFLGSIAFTSSINGIFVGGGGVIYQTIDGGATWNPILYNPLNNNAIQFQGVAFSSATNGVAVGTYSSNTFYRTTNGGNTWTIVNPGTSVWFHSIAFSSATNGVAVGFNGTIVRTTDGGATWTTINSGATSEFNGITFLPIN